MHLYFRIFRLSTSFIVLLAVHTISALAATQYAYQSAACDAANVLNTNWYNETTGLWQRLWWQSGNVLATLSDLSLLNPSADNMKITQHVYSTTARNAGDQLGYNGFKNGFYDDEGWWAMGWLRAYDVTQNKDYLDIAVDIFGDMIGGYNATCGGHWWNKEDSGDVRNNNAIGNLLFFQVAASLANRHTAKKEYYTSWAHEEWDWFQNSGMINSSNIINEGLDLTTCKSNGKNGYTYVQGVILSALVELHTASPNQTLLDTATTLAKSAITHPSLVTDDGILFDVGDPDEQGAMFKGAFVRNLKQLHKAAPAHEYVNFLQKNADTMMQQGKGSDGTYSPIWQGPFRPDLVNAASQTAAIDLLIAAAAVSV